MAENRQSISSSRISPTDISRSSFAIVRRGFDPREVRSFLEHIAIEMEQLEAKEVELRRAVADANERALHPVLDEEALTAALGSQSTQVLQAAHDQARGLMESAQSQANEMLQAAQLRASAGIVAAEQKAAARVGDAESLAANLEEDATKMAQQMIGQAQADGETLVARARAQGRSMIEQAQDARARVLTDMNARRRMMHVQIEQLRAARDELARSIIGVRETIDRLTDDIGASDEAARAAAQEVARRQPTPEELTEDPSGLLGEVTGTQTPIDAEGELEVMAEPTEPPDTQVVEELFAKIRASARTRNGDGRQSSPEPAKRSISSNDVAGGSKADLGAHAARDGALSSPRSTLTRKVKRVLQDEQNRILEELREGRSAEIMAESLSRQASLFASAAVDPLADAANAGSKFAHDHGVKNNAVLSHDAVMVVAEQLAEQITVPLQRRLLDALESEDPSASIGASFREWRGNRLDRIVGDVALEAFSAAIVASAGSGLVRWVTGGENEPCPDCADNALEGPIAAGLKFPTGHAYPPSHGGCRCAILPSL
jgi:cell division septum initiation protein DivIVA